MKRKLEIEEPQRQNLGGVHPDTHTLFLPRHSGGKCLLRAPRSRRSRSSDVGVGHRGFKSLLCYLNHCVALGKITYLAVSVSPSVKWEYLGDLPFRAFEKTMFPRTEFL